MGNSLRCCLACVLPCGALDLIRIVHLNGYVEEIAHPITAGEVLKANPNHVLSKPSYQGVVRKISIVSPDSELKRGTIYFLIPTTSSLPGEKEKTCDAVSGGDRHRRRRHRSCKVKHYSSSTNKSTICVINAGDFPTDQYDGYLADAISEKKSSSSRDRRSGTRVGVWRPHLQSISED